MRIALAAVVVLVACGAHAHAQPASYVAEVTAESVTVRTGPGEQMPDTGTLPRGTKVVVDHAEGDKWVAIQPPRGQVSWIKNLNLGPVEGQQQTLIPRNAVVNAEPDAEISYGRPGSGTPMDVRRTKLPDGTVVLVIGQSVDYQNAKWVPIEPPDGDFRYVPVSALQVTQGQSVQAFVVKSPQPVLPLTTVGGGEGRSGGEGHGGSEPITASVPGTPPGKPVGPVKPANWPNHPLWQQAEAAETAGDFDAAKKLYLQLAAEMNKAGGDTELANQCFARVHAIGEKRRLARSGQPAAASPRVSTTTQPPEGAVAGSTQPQWLSGTLRASGFRLYDQPTYALEDAQRRVKCYAVAGPGVSLDSFRGYEADIFGSVTSRDDLRGVGVMTVTRIQAVRDR